MLRRLKIKFVCINMLIVTSLLAVVFGMVLTFTSKNMAFQNMQMLQMIHQSQFYKVPKEPDIRVPYFTVQFGSQGTLSVSTSNFFGQMTEQDLVNLALTAKNREHASGVLKEHDLQYSRQITPFGERIVFIDISRDRAIMTDLLKTSGLIGFVSFAVFFVISVGFAQWAVKPVDEAWRQQKQFVSDASHELKTPLTVILTNAELLTSERYDASSKQQFTQSIYAMSLQMRGLVESLLELARLDSGSSKMHVSDLDISRLVEVSTLPFEPLFFEAGFHFETKIQDSLVIKGSEPHLQQVLDILLDNARKYSTPGTTVSLSLQRQGNTCIFSVSGRGMELSSDDLQNIFKRFYRMDQARTMNHSYGLGLSIAKSIVQEHNGKIWAESENGLNTFFVQLPLQRESR